MSNVTESVDRSFHCKQHERERERKDEGRSEGRKERERREHGWRWRREDGWCQWINSLNDREMKCERTAGKKKENVKLERDKYKSLKKQKETENKTKKHRRMFFCQSQLPLRFLFPFQGQIVFLFRIPSDFRYLSVHRFIFVLLSFLLSHRLFLQT